MVEIMQDLRSQQTICRIERIAAERRKSQKILISVSFHIFHAQKYLLYRYLLNLDYCNRIAELKMHLLLGHAASPYLIMNTFAAIKVLLS